MLYYLVSLARTYYRNLVFSVATTLHVQAIQCLKLMQFVLIHNSCFSLWVYEVNTFGPIRFSGYRDVSMFTAGILYASIAKNVCVSEHPDIYVCWVNFHILP